MLGYVRSPLDISFGFGYWMLDKRVFGLVSYPTSLNLTRHSWPDHSSAALWNCQWSAGKPAQGLQVGDAGRNINLEKKQLEMTPGFVSFGRPLSLSDVL